MSDATPRLNLPLVGDHSQKRIVMNAGLMRLECLVQAAVISRTLAVQPSVPADGDAYILPVGATGADWARFTAGDLVRYDSLLWEAIAFPPGAIVHIGDEGRFVVRSGSGWTPFEDAIAALDALSHIGINTTADATNVLALKGPAALMSAAYAADGGTGDISLVLNKEGPSDTAQLLLQKNYATHAILGLLGDTRTTLKVSPDGASFVTALSIDPSSGAVALAGGAVTQAAVGIGSADTGLYRVDSTTLGVSLGGVHRLAFSGGGMVVNATGSVSSNISLDGEASVLVRASRYSNDATGPNVSWRKARGTVAAPVAVTNGDVCGQNQVFAHTGSGFVSVGNHQFVMAETTPSPGAMGALWKLSLCAAGAVTVSEILRLDHAGGLSMFGTNTVIDKNRHFRLRVYTVATLPAAATAAGQCAMVSDASSPSFAATVSGGGSTHVPVYSDGSNWRCG